MAGFKGLAVGMAFILIFGIAYLSFITNYTTDNNSNVTLDTDYNSALTQIKGNSTNFAITVNSSYEGYSQSELAGGSENVQTGGFLKILPTDLYDGVKAIINLSFLKVFGSDTDFGIVLRVLSSVLVLIILLFGVKLWLGRTPD